MARLYRWLAFMHIGGGLYVEYDVLPNALFTNESVPNPDGVNVLEQGEWSVVSADRRGLTYVADIITEHRYNTLTLPTDKELLETHAAAFWKRNHDIVRPWNSPDWSTAPLVHFSTKACKTAGATVNKASMVEQFLKSIKRLG
jgi:hypothetical protein